MLFIQNKPNDSKLSSIISCHTLNLQLFKTRCISVKFLCSLVLKCVWLKCLSYTNDSITPPFKCASRDSVLLPKSEERMKLTSANSLYPRHLYYDFLLKPYLSYNEFRSGTREEFFFVVLRDQNKRPAD